MAPGQELINRAVNRRAWDSKRSAARTKDSHPCDAPLGIHECPPFPSWAESHAKSNEAIDGATTRTVPRPTRERHDPEGSQRAAFMTSDSHHHLAGAQ
jgi:hypothetical protein